MCWSTTRASPGSDQRRTWTSQRLTRCSQAMCDRAYFLVAALAPRMVERGSGSIINMGSMAGQIGLAGGAAYGATKAAQAALARAWAAEFRPHGVRVNAVAPGPVFTGGAAPDRTERLGSTTLLNPGAQAKEIDAVVAFLASPKSSYITGATDAVDGGGTAV